MRSAVDDTPTRLDRIRSVLRRVAHESYHRLAGYNYRHTLVSRRNDTPAGSFRSYEPLNRHGDDPLLAAIDRSCGSDAVIYDIGANVGVYALALATDQPERQVVAVEPAPSTVDHCRTNVLRNSCGEQIAIEACGLGERTGTEQFYVSSSPELSSFDRASATRWGASIVRTVDVPVRTLDELASDHPLPDVIKIDVEGAAAAVIAGGRETIQDATPTLFIEPHSDGLDDDPTAPLRTRLDAVGYTVADHGEYWRCVPNE